MNEQDRAGRVRSLERAQRERHVFAVGQTVKLRSGFWKPYRSAEIFRVMAALPLIGDEPQYRIRGDDERHERVATQDALEAV